MLARTTMVHAVDHVASIPTSASTMRDDYDRCALRLNNMGVQLIVHGDHRAAMHTLRDALTVMKMVYPREAATAALPQMAVDVEAMLLRGSQRLAAQGQGSAAAAAKVAPTRILSLYEDFVSLYPPASSTSYSYPVLIEPMEGTEDIRDHDLESATLLYNFGLAHLCHSIAFDDSTSTTLQLRAHRLHKATVKFLKLSQTLLAGRLSDLLSPTQVDDDEHDHPGQEQDADTDFPSSAAIETSIRMSLSSPTLSADDSEAESTLFDRHLRARYSMTLLYLVVKDLARTYGAMLTKPERVHDNDALMTEPTSTVISYEKLCHLCRLIHQGLVTDTNPLQLFFAKLKSQPAPAA